MRPPPLLSVLLLALAPATALPAAALAQAAGPGGGPDEGNEPTLASQLRGLQALERARDALAEGGGPEAAPRGLVLWMTGSTLQTDQSPTPDPPFDTLPSEERIAFDLAGDRASIEFRAWWPDFVRHVEQSAGPDGGLVRDFNQDTERWSRQLTTGRLASLRRRVPQVALRDALAAPGSVRHLGRADLEGRAVEVVAYLDPGGTVASLLVERGTGLPLGVERLVDDLRYGDATERTRWEAYRTEAGLRLPGRTRVTVSGEPLATMVLDSATTSSAAVEAALAPLEAARAERGSSGEPSPDSPGTITTNPAGGVRLEEIAEGVWVATADAAPGYHILVVDLGTELLVAEAPAPEEATAAILTEASRQLDKPVGHGVVTHHHGDHAGGVGAFVRSGIPVWTTPGNVAFVRDVATAPRRLAGLPTPLDPPEIRVVEEEARLSGPPTVILRDVGPHPHAEEHLVVMVPEAGVVFQGDLVRFPPDGTVEPARPQTEALLRLVEDLEWPVRSIVGVHGRAGTVEDLRRAMEAREEGRGGGRPPS